MSLGNIILSKGSQSQKTTNYMIPLYEMSRIGKSVETESRSVITRSWEKRGMENE